MANGCEKRSGELCLVVLLMSLLAFTPIAFGADNAEAAKVLRSAKILFDAKDYAGAKRSLEDVLRNTPDHAEATLWIARCDEATGDFVAALKGYNRVLDLAKANPKEVDENTRRLALLAVQRLDEGKKIVQRYVKLMEGEADRLKGKNDQAFATLMAAIKLLQADEIDTKATTISSQRRHPNDAVEFNGHWYKRFDGPVTWHVAKHLCEEMGGYLACIESKEENDFITRRFQAECWLGGTDEEEEGVWRWLNGSPWRFTDWSRGNPSNNDNKEHSLILFSMEHRAQFGGPWNDGSAGHRTSYLCEWER